ncbi:MAG: hypothetical protein K2N71_05440 [Oscillospiraceae bacterium]|nr:hypothetical protein [Oscillospiraceae bacterium]
MKKHIIVIICIILVCAGAGIFVPSLSFADCAALSAVAFAVYAAIVYTVKRKKQGKCCSCCMNCACCQNYGNCKSENKTEEQT